MAIEPIPELSLDDELPLPPTRTAPPPAPVATTSPIGPYIFDEDGDLVYDDSDPEPGPEDDHFYPEEPAPSDDRSLHQALLAEFPFETIRPVQTQALELIAQSSLERKKYTIIEAPTGAGKSPLGFAAARAFHKGFYLTSQNSLSSQMMRDFKHLGLAQIKGKRNYTCDNHDTNCDDGAMMNRGKACDGCPYRAAKNRFKAARVGVTNYTYYIADMMYTGELGRSSVLVLDEAHNLERELLSTVDIKITPGRCQEIEAGALPRFAPQTTGSCQRWLDKTFIPKAKAYSAHLRNQIDLMSPGSDSPSAEEKQLQRKLDVLTSLLANVERFMKADDDEPWLAWSDDEGVLFIKPMSATGLAERHLFKHTDNVLLMSATILDFPTFRRNLGITAAESNSIAVPSDFPKENRRIIYWPVGNMGFKDIQATLPRMIERIIKLLDKWHDKKGIIHTHNYRITNELVAALKGTKFRTRVLTHTSLPGSREKAVEDHLNSEFETVLISPSMTEGLDLKDELSRFQIITKVPYPFLDPYTKARMERDPKWYQLQTALTLVQATGRSVRSKDDHAITVILDGAFERFLIQNQDILPEWWKESLEFR